MAAKVDRILVLLLVLFLGTQTLVSSMACAQTFCFASPRTFATGFFPIWIAVGDVNNDHHDDIVLANDSALNDVSVLLGDGSGNLGSARTITIGYGYNSPTSVALGDLDEDGNLDLVVTKTNINNLAILLGDGRGGFSFLGDLFLENSSPESIIVSDLNDDQHLDLVFANRGTGTAGVLLGNGDGTFGMLRSFRVTTVDDPLPGFSEPISVVAGDFDGDHKLDLAVAMRVRDHVAILLGNGAGDFTTPIIVPLNDPPYTSIDFKSLTTLDFDNDGVLDLAISHRNLQRVDLLKGDGAGNFLLIQTISSTGPLGNVVSADFNDDGMLDLAWVSADPISAIGRIYIAPGQDSTYFGNSETFPLPEGSNPRFVAVGYFQDGAPDLVTANRGSHNGSLLVNSLFINRCPVAVAGENQTAMVGERIQLDGRSSFDPDGDILNFKWFIISQPYGSITAPDEDATMTPTIVPDLPGDYEIGLTVDDGICQSSSAALTVTTLTAEQILCEIVAEIQGFPDSSFKSGGFNSFSKVLGDIANLVSRGNLDAAMRKADDLRTHVDGCLTALGEADRNDWIAECASQVTLRRLVDGLMRTLGQ